MPMITEVIVAMLACARIGAVHSIVVRNNGRLSSPERWKRISLLSFLSLSLSLLSPIRHPFHICHSSTFLSSFFPLHLFPPPLLPSLSLLLSSLFSLLPLAKLCQIFSSLHVALISVCLRNKLCHNRGFRHVKHKCFNFRYAFSCWNR